MKITIERLGWGRGYSIRVQLHPLVIREYTTPSMALAIEVVRTFTEGDEWREHLQRTGEEERRP